MPNWKRVIVSGSDAALTSVIATAGFTGSLLGTASYATNALSASYAQTSSYATYAANGGVTKILAGANVNLSPVNGLGDVTVTSFGTNLYNTATGSYGSFYDTGSVLASSATAVYSMSLSTTDISNGVFVSASNGDVTRVKFTNAGTYNLQFSSQFSNTDNSNQDVIVWVRKNGVDIPDSSGVAAVPPFKAGSNGQVIAAWNYYLSLSADDFIQMCWHVEQANVITLETIPAGVGPTHPRTPSTILTATRVDTFLSNTGSFSGSFTGTLTGTASYAVTASYALNGGGATFPFIGAAQITGSLEISGSLSNGDGNIASGIGSHAEGATTTAQGDFSHAEGQSTNAIGTYSHAEGWATIASGSYQHVQGQFNILSSAQSAFIVGNGTNLASRSNLIFAAGSQVEITGSLTVTAGITGSLLGTASYATQALSASWAPGGAGTPTFPYTGSAIISGSLEVTGSLLVQDSIGTTNIDSQNRKLYTNNGTGVALQWNNNTFLDSNVYQRDYKSAATQDAVSTNYANVSLSYLGDVIESNGTTTIIDSTVTEGMLVYLDTSTVWYPVNQAAPGATKLLGIAHDLVSLPPNPPPFPTNKSGKILLEGHVVIDDTSTAGPNVQNADHGLPVYITNNTSTGTMSTTVPTATGSNIVRVLGHCYQQNSGTATQWMMKFRPSNDWVEI